VPVVCQQNMKTLGTTTAKIGQQNHDARLGIARGHCYLTILEMIEQLSRLRKPVA